MYFKRLEFISSSILAEEWAFMSMVTVSVQVCYSHVTISFHSMGAPALKKVLNRYI